jgi:hypothetical protein
MNIRIQNQNFYSHMPRAGNVGFSNPYSQLIGISLLSLEFQIECKKVTMAVRPYLIRSASL